MLGIKVRNALQGYFKGQLVLVFVNFIVFWLILTVLKIDHAVFLALVSGILSSIPLFGLPLASLLAYLVSVIDGSQFTGFHPALEGILVILIYVIFNQIVDFVISPYIMGTALKLSPLALLLAVLAGTLFFGVAGTFFAVPVFIILKTVYDEKYSGKKS